MMPPFWSKVDRSGGPDACWEWQAGRTKHGYGWLRGPDGRNTRAHRLAWELTNGPIPSTDSHHGTLCVCHTCDNRLCCNPAHLFLGSQATNVRDMMQKHRHRAIPSAEVHTAKLTWGSVSAIRCLKETGKYTHAALGRLFGVHTGTARAIVLRRTWA